MPVPNTMSVSINSTVRTYPSHDYAAIAKAIVGAKYELTLIFVGEARAQKLNQETRGKTYVPNVLSFPVTESVGEIYICPSVAKREAKNFDLTPKGYVAYLFIHGLLHLKGHDHGDTMEQLERRYLKQFGIK